MSVQHIWDDLLTERDRAVIEQAGYARRGAASWDSRTLGSRPALLVIDMLRRFVGPDRPILEAIDTYRTAMGDVAWQAMAQIVPFVEACRAAGLPVFHARIVPRGQAAEDADLAFIEPLAPLPGEVTINKRGQSVFYETTLREQLRQLACDTVILTGNATSGCIRATAVDARQAGLGVLVPAECVFDRVEVSHRVGLLDIWMKIGVVATVDEALDYVRDVSGS